MVETTRRPPRLEIALVGCGEVAEHKHLPALRKVKGARVTALADRDRGRLDRVATRFGIPARFSSVDELLAAGRPDILGVLVPPAEHASVTVAALRAGCHVLVEKPLALSMSDAEAMAVAESRSDGRLIMGFHMRWHRGVRRLRDAISAGRIGRPESFSGTWSSPRSDDGIPDWKIRRASGGGSIVELGVHLVDLMCFLTGERIDSVYAAARHGRREDERAAVILGSASGVLGHLSLSERSSHQIEIQVCGDGGRVRLSAQRFDGFESYAVAETDGMIRPRLRRLVSTLGNLPRGLAGLRTLGDYGDSYRAQWQHVVAVAGGAEPGCGIEDGVGALRVVLAAAESARTGSPIRVTEAPSSIAGASRA